MKPPKMPRSIYEDGLRQIRTEGAFLELHLYPANWWPPECRYFLRNRFWRYEPTSLLAINDEFSLATDVCRWALEEATMEYRQSLVVPSPAVGRRRTMPPPSGAASFDHRPPSGEGMPQG